jgi:hypothetical protein
MAGCERPDDARRERDEQEEGGGRAQASGGVRHQGDGGRELRHRKHGRPRSREPVGDAEPSQRITCARPVGELRDGGSREHRAEQHLEGERQRLHSMIVAV